MRNGNDGRAARLHGRVGPLVPPPARPLPAGAPGGAAPLNRPEGARPGKRRFGTIGGVSVTLPARILVVRLGAIGDVTNALVLATAIKDASPHSEIGWVIHPLARPLVDDHPAVDRVHVWPRRSGVGGWRRLVREIRGERYELAADLQRIAKSAVLARASRAPRVLGADRGRTKELSWLFTKMDCKASQASSWISGCQAWEASSSCGSWMGSVRANLP